MFPRRETCSSKFSSKLHGAFDEWADAFIFLPGGMGAAGYSAGKASLWKPTPQRPNSTRNQVQAACGSYVMSVLKVVFGRDIDRSHNISTPQKDKEEGGSQTLGFSLNSHLEANTLASKEEYETCLPHDDLIGTCYKEKTETINDLFLKTLCAHMPLAGLKSCKEFESPGQVLSVALFFQKRGPVPKR